MSTAIIDFSWLMHRNKHALSSLTTEINGQVIPTGHVYGSLVDIYGSAISHDSVVLCVDSSCTVRKQVLSTYKADRHPATGDPILDYNIYNDQLNILSIATAIPNVYYCKVKEMEADDLIGSFIVSSKDKSNLDCYFNDNDIMQNPGEYNWFTNFNSGLTPLSREDYLNNKFGFDQSWLPLWYKVMLGDTSDRIPNLFPRFNREWVKKLCSDLGKTWSFNKFIAYLESDDFFLMISKTWRDRIYKDGDLSKGLDEKFKAQLKRNYDVVVPRPCKVADIPLKKVDPQSYDLDKLLSRYCLNSIRSFYQEHGWV